MREITLVQVPGTGASRVSVSDDWTVERLVTEFNLHGRSIIINGQQVDPNQYQSKTLAGAVEIFATATVKGA